MVTLHKRWVQRHALLAVRGRLCPLVHTRISSTAKRRRVGRDSAWEGSNASEAIEKASELGAAALPSVRVQDVVGGLRIDGFSVRGDSAREVTGLEVLVALAATDRTRGRTRRSAK